MIAEVDPGAGLRDLTNILENLFERFGRHQIGNESRYPARCRCRGFDRNVLFFARPCDVIAMPEMQMNVEHARQHQQPRYVEGPLGFDLLDRRHQRGNFAVGNRDGHGLRIASRNRDLTANDGQIENHDSPQSWRDGTRTTFRTAQP